MARNKLHNDSGTKQNLRPADGEIETWTYVGRRFLTGNKIGYAWIDATDEEVMFDKIKATVVGGLYEIEVVRGGDKLSVYKNTVKYVGPSGSDKDTVAKWAALDKAAYTEQQRRAVERKAAKEDQPLANLTLAQVATMVRRSPSQRSAIIATVINEILYGSL